MTKNKLKISVIVPIFNSEKFLDKCIESILKQTYTNIELICVNDGSIDSSLEICKHWQNKDKRITIINTPNCGLSSARNLGIEKATGDLISFIDSDDYIEPNIFECLVKNITETTSDISMYSFFMENEDGSEHCTCERLEDKTYSNIEALELLSASRQDRYVVAWNKLYKKELFQNIKFPIGKLHEDQAVMHYLFFKANKISTISDKLYHYIVHNNSLSHENNPIKHFDDIDALFDRIGFYKRNQLNKLLPGVEETMLHLFSFYKNKALNYGKCSNNEIKIIKSYGKKCFQFFKECTIRNHYTKQNLKERKKTYSVSWLEKIKLKHSISMKNNRIYKFCKKLKINKGEKWKKI